MTLRVSRRTMLTAATALAAAPLAMADQPRPLPKLTGEIGLTTGSFMRHYSPTAKPGKLVLLDLPGIMRDRLGMRVIDLMTYTMPETTPAYADRFRRAADDAGCTISNFKLNQRDLEIASTDPAERRRALKEYKRTIDLAERLGCHWVRPLPGSKRPDMKVLVASYRELIDYAGPKGITLLIENNRWLSDDPTAIPAVLAAVGEGLAAAPDTGNWTDRARYKGLEKAFPHAVTCDYKAQMLGPNNEHPQYDLRRCFQIAWKSGFRGPWCLEHFNQTLEGTIRGMQSLKKMLQGWMSE